MAHLSQSSQPVVRVAAGADRFLEYRRLGINEIVVKLAPADSRSVLLIEAVSHARGGPERHLHLKQDEWFFPLEGEYRFEVGEESFTLGPGDSILAPRRVPHVWAYAGSAKGRMLILFNPAGKMLGFFREAAKATLMPGRDLRLWRRYGMEWVGPPLALD